MNRLAAFLLGALLAAAVMAAPAPAPKPCKMWTAGWGKPVDPLGGCRFEIDGDKLTVTVARKERIFDVWERRQEAPHLLREVEGDFLVEVRVRVRPVPRPDEGCCLAGLLLVGGGNAALLRLRGAGSNRSCEKCPL
jgi:hypothetical protein